MSLFGFSQQDLCATSIISAKPEYRAFLKFILKPTNPLLVPTLNFHLKYTMVRTSDSAIKTPPLPGEIPSLTADFITRELKNCNTLYIDNVQLTDFFGNNGAYRVLLNTTNGVLTITDIATKKSKAFTLSSLGYGIYSGSVTSTLNSFQIKETVVVVLTRQTLEIGQ